jgi:hypothetical protein
MKPLAANSLLQNRYLIIHHIGKGGMGEVYLAVDQRLGNPVALKRTVFRDDKLMWEAFEREARILARLRHSVLPKVSDHFSETEEQYLVMEYISGDDLAKRLEVANKPFPLQWVLYWADELLDALSYLHTHEPPIIHRDIKPQNLKLTAENHVVLLDFGLAKNSVAKKTDLSSSGSLVGYTPHYAPIEQVRGTGTGARSDLYSLSATLYQLMTGTVPVDALTRAEGILGGGKDALPSPGEVVPGIPAAVAAVVMRGMELNSEQRYRDAKEMQKALREAYNHVQGNAAAAAEPFDGAETVVSTPALATPETSATPKANAQIFDTKDVERMFENAQNTPAPNAGKAAPLVYAEDNVILDMPTSDKWSQGETQGFTPDEQRRTTIDEEAFRKLGFASGDADPEPLSSAAPFASPVADTPNAAPADAPFVPAPVATAAEIIPPTYVADSKPHVSVPVNEIPVAPPPTEEWSDLREKPTPIKPHTKPLDPAAKVEKKSSGLGMKLIGLAAVLCFLVAGAGAAGWYAVHEKWITVPGFEPDKPAMAEQPKKDSADITTSDESFKETGNSATETKLKDSPATPAEGSLTPGNPAERDSGDKGDKKATVKTPATAPKTGPKTEKTKPKAQQQSRTDIEQ